MAISGLLSIGVGAGLDYDRLQQSLVSRFGNGPLQRFYDWRQMLAAARSLSEMDKIRRVNDFFNRQIMFQSDWDVWGQADYWATPMETIGQGRGDCEDFSIAKYYSLLELGIPMQKLRMVYVKALLNGIDGQYNAAHMILAYYPSANSEPLVLDSLIPEIRPASRRTDLTPVFSFNSSGLWQGTGNQASGSNLSRWQDLLSRARAEGFQ